MCFFFTGIPLFLSFFWTIDGMFRHIDSDFFDLVILQCRFAGQLKVAVSGQCLFDPFDGSAYCTFVATVVDTDVFHCTVFSVVLQCDEKFVADGEVGRFAAGLVCFVIGNLQDVCHSLKDRFGGPDDAFELFVRQFEGFFGSFHDISLDSFTKNGYYDEKNSNFGDVRKDQNRDENGYATSLL